MLVSLSIKNYALIHDLTVDFTDGFSIITGETGAGKSILLGGLSLVLGKRADMSSVYDKDSKCVVEAHFLVKDYDLKSFFQSYDLDYEDELILRRELLPNGKSRAFINDTPCNLMILSELADKIIDIHSQHETLQLADRPFQFKIVDSMAGIHKELNSYESKYRELSQVRNKLKVLKEEQDEANRAFDFNSFMHKELTDAKLIAEEQQQLEDSLELLSHAEEIKTVLSDIYQLAERESFGLNDALAEIRNNLNRISKYSESFAQLSQRWDSFCIEATDMLSDIEAENDDLVHDPSELERVEQRLHLIYSLQKKHLVSSVEELLEVQEDYLNKLTDVENASDRISEQEALLQRLESELIQLAEVISKSRAKAIPRFTENIETLLSELEMKNTRLRVSIKKGDQLLPNGMDELEFMISSDKGNKFESLKRIASGGEMSRIMLAVKYILSNYTHLPAIIFDEIDTGVSGEVSNRIADLMTRMSENMQVISITHLPQVAAKGSHHYLVYKEDSGQAVSSNIRVLNDNERLVHLAEMLGGSEITESALAHAKQLLS